MSAFLRALALTFTTSLRRTTRSRRALVMFLLALAPSVPVFLLSEFRPRVDATRVVASVSWFVLLQVIVPLVAVIAGSAVVAEEVADRTISYVFTRPVSRAAFFLGRAVASVTIVVAVVAIGALALFAVVRVNQTSGGAVPAALAGQVLRPAVLGGLCYGAIFAATSACFEHPMVVGLGYAFAVEGVLTNLPGTTSHLSIQYQLRCLLVNDDRPFWMGLAADAGARYGTATDALTAIVATILVSTIAGVWVVLRKQYRVRS